MKKRTKKIVWISLAVLAVMIAVWTFFNNILVGTTHYTLSFDSLPKEFDGFRIAQVSDFHNADMWDFSQKTLDIVREAKPDIIAITGDLVDSKRTDVKVSLDFVKELAEIAPCYFVTGNHEGFLDDVQWSVLMNGLESCGVTILRDEAVILSRNGADIRIAGLHDMTISYGIDDIPKTVGNDDIFTVLLSHRPEYYEDYKAAGVQLVLTGHAHGGQVRLPFIGGLYAPNQGIFPKYDGGVYREGDYAMCVSRGIGNSVFPVRFNNMPEVVVVELSQ